MRVIYLIALLSCTKAQKVTHRTKVGIAIGAPHSGRIEQIAITDEGDAALTADAFGSLRIWPRLDGTREPIVVPIADAPIEVALGHDGDGFVGAVLDQPGNVAILDFDRNGGFLGRVQVGDEVPSIHIVALKNTILVLRADSSIVQLDIRGKQLGRVAAPPKAHLQWLATRHGHAIAATARTIYRFDVDDGLAWADTFKLGINIAGPIGLSPNGRRVTALNEALNRIVIVELAPIPRLVVHHKLYSVAAPVASGFVDNDHAIVPSGDALRWWNPPFVAPLMNQWIQTNPVALAVGDGIAVAGEQTGLELAAPNQPTRHLGYKLLAQGGTSELDGVTLVRVSTREGSAYLRVDGQLRDQGIAIDEEVIDVRFADLDLSRHALSHDARLVASVDDTHVAVTDKTGERRWAIRVDGPRSARFTYDDQHVIIASAGGIIAVDAATGRQTARACAWRFGLFDTPIASGTLTTAPNVCE